MNDKKSIYNNGTWNETAEAEPIFDEMVGIVSVFMKSHSPDNFNPRAITSYFYRGVYGNKPDEDYLDGFPLQIWNLVQPVMEKHAQYKLEELQLLITDAINVEISGTVLDWAVARRRAKRKA